MASEMVNKWRAEVKKTTTKPSASGAKLSAGTGSSNGPRTPEPSTARQTPEPRPAAAGSNLQRTYQKDGVDTKRLGDTVRDGSVGLMYNALAYGTNVSKCSPLCLSSSPPPPSFLSEGFLSICLSCCRKSGSLTHRPSALVSPTSSVESHPQARHRH